MGDEVQFGKMRKCQGQMVGLASPGRAQGCSLHRLESPLWVLTLFKRSGRGGCCGVLCRLGSAYSILRLTQLPANVPWRQWVAAWVLGSPMSTEGDADGIPGFELA